MIDDLDLAQLVADLEEETVLKVIHERIDRGDDLMKIMDECNEGMHEVGRRYEKGEYFIAGLIMSGEIFRQVMELVGPLLTDQRTGLSPGKVLLGTVAGDIHDLGKNMFSFLLASHGFDIIDLGVDVAPEVFSRKILETKPDIIALSGLITASHWSMKETVTVLKDMFREKNISIPIIIGGGFIDAQIHEYVGSDYWTKDVMEGVRLCLRLVGMPSEEV